MVSFRKAAGSRPAAMLKINLSYLEPQAPKNGIVHSLAGGHAYFQKTS